MSDTKICTKENPKAVPQIPFKAGPAVFRDAEDAARRIKVQVQFYKLCDHEPRCPGTLDELPLRFVMENLVSKAKR